MKIMTILGTRPEIIRLNLIIAKLDRACRQVLVHTGQNYDRNLNDVFMEELAVRRPDHFLGARGTFGEQIGTILAGCERIMRAERPDRFLVLGDTNSSLAAIMAKRLGIPVFHMEAGNRCHDDRVPEEVNRRLIDHSSDVLMPYSERSRHNLLAEGIPGRRIFVTGNPIREVLQHFQAPIDASDVLARMGLQAGEYFLVTLHRAENVDVPERLAGFLQALQDIRRQYGLPVVCSVHPHTRRRLDERGWTSDDPMLMLLEPLPFFAFVHLEKNARCVLSDSGTVQEECCIFRVPSVTLRDTTERPETVEVGSNILSGADPGRILTCLEIALGRGRDWRPPREYMEEHVSDTVLHIVLGHHNHPAPHWF